ncbi:MAG: TolC family protein [Planctomycetota bacterium]
MRWFREVFAMIAATCVVAGCTVHPEGEASARAQLERAGADLQPPISERALPVLDESAVLADYVAHALLANGEIEAAWAEWSAALEEVPMAGSQEATAMIGLDHRLGGGAWFDRTGLVLASEAMNNLVFPGRLRANADAALARAMAAAARFDALRIRLARDVAEEVIELGRIDAEDSLLRQLRDVLAIEVQSLRGKLQSGVADQSMLLTAQSEWARNESELEALAVQRIERAAKLRVLLGGVAPGFVAVGRVPEPHEFAAGEAEALRARVQSNPALHVLRAERVAARAGLEVAEWDREPGFSLRSVLMGDGGLTLGGMLSLPFLRHEAIDAAVSRARAAELAARARERQGLVGASAEIDVALAMLDALSAQRAILDTEVVPSLRQAASVARAAWSTGRGDLRAWAMSLRAAIEVERAVLALRARSAVVHAGLRAAAGWLPE